MEASNKPVNQKHMVSRKENEEILLDDQGNPVLSSEIDTPDATTHLFNGLETPVTKEIDLDSGQSIDSQQEGIED